jgi:MFS family permease
MVAVDASVVTIALPRISSDLSGGISELSWVVTGYVTATAALLLIAGKAGDKYGKKKVYLLGFALFGISSALCGISQTVPDLIAFRVFQGGAAAMLAATSYPLVFESFRPGERGSALSMNSVAWAVGAAAGPVLGGFLVAIDWRLVFYVNVPVAAIAVLIGRLKIPAALDIAKKRSPPISVTGSIMLATAVVFVLLWLTLLNGYFGYGAAAILVVLAFNEARSRTPLFSRELRGRGFVYSIAGLGVLEVAFLGIPFLLSFYFQSMVGLPSILAGAAIAPLPIATAFANSVAGRLFDRTRAPALIALAGAGMSIVGTIVLSQLLGGKGPYLSTVWMLLLIGAGQGFIWTPLIGSILKFSKPELRGLANGVAFTIVNVGSAASIAVGIATSAISLPAEVVSKAYFGDLAGLTPPEIALLSDGLRNAFMALGIVGVAAVPLVYLIQREQKRLAIQNPR